MLIETFCFTAFAIALANAASLDGVELCGLDVPGFEDWGLLWPPVVPWPLCPPVLPCGLDWEPWPFVPPVVPWPLWPFELPEPVVPPVVPWPLWPLELPEPVVPPVVPWPLWPFELPEPVVPPVVPCCGLDWEPEPVVPPVVPCWGLLWPPVEPCGLELSGFPDGLLDWPPCEGLFASGVPGLLGVLGLLVWPPWSPWPFWSGLFWSGVWFEVVDAKPPTTIAVVAAVCPLYWIIALTAVVSLELADKLETVISLALKFVLPVNVVTFATKFWIAVWTALVVAVKLSLEIAEATVNFAAALVEAMLIWLLLEVAPLIAVATFSEVRLFTVVVPLSLAQATAVPATAGTNNNEPAATPTTHFNFLDILILFICK